MAITICGSSSVYLNGIIGIFQSLCTVYNFKIKTKWTLNC